MRSASIAAFLSFAAAALAIQVTSPTNATGWTTTGPNVVSWNRVDTDPTNFTIVLSNQAHFPPTSDVLLALVDATKGSSATVNPPSGGWVAGPGFRVNIVKSADELNTILAQSDDFTIKDGTGSSTFSSGSASSTLTVTGGSPTNTPAAQQNTNTANTNSNGAPSNTDTSLNPTNTNVPSGVLPAFNMQAGVFAVLALVGSFLA